MTRNEKITKAKQVLLSIIETEEIKNGVQIRENRNSFCSLASRIAQIDDENIMYNVLSNIRKMISTEIHRLTNNISSPVFLVEELRR